MIKLSFEDGELEEFALEGDSDVAVPISVSEDVSGELTVTVYSRFAKEGEDFALSFADDPLSPEAIKNIDEVFAPLMRGYGFAYERDFDQTVLTYVSDGVTSKPAVPVELIDTEEKRKQFSYQTALDFEIDDEDPLDVAFAVTDGERAVSVAAVNDYSDDGSVEINVETAPECRGRGFATAAVSALCLYLEEHGERVTYKCRASNAPSRRVAEKAGLLYRNRTFYYVCYKN